jgi:hypothetical protein
LKRRTWHCQPDKQVVIIVAWAWNDGAASYLVGWLLPTYGLDYAVSVVIYMFLLLDLQSGWLNPAGTAPPGQVHSAGTARSMSRS